MTLVTRRRTGCTLTADGEIFLNYARKCLDDHERICSYFAGKNNGWNIQNSLDVIFTNSFLSTCTSEAISAFRHEYPDIKINVKVMNERKMEGYIRGAGKNDYLFLCSLQVAAAAIDLIASSSVDQPMDSLPFFLPPRRSMVEGET